MSFSRKTRVLTPYPKLHKLRLVQKKCLMNLVRSLDAQKHHACQQSLLH